MSRRTILVTGAARGMGAAVCAHLDAQGHRTIGLDLEDVELQADLSTAEGRAKAAAETIRLGDGQLDAVIACAGLAGAPPKLVISVNYFGVSELLATLRPQLAQSSAPRAVVIASSSVLLGHDDALVEACLSGDEALAHDRIPENANLVYSSTKVAISRWVRRTAVQAEWAGSGILLNAVSPGCILTRITRPILATEEGRAMMAQSTPIAVPAYGEPEDVAPLLAFLASPDCRYVVGQNLFIDGGSDCLLRGETVPA